MRNHSVFTTLLSLILFTGLLGCSGPAPTLAPTANPTRAATFTRAATRTAVPKISLQPCKLSHVDAWCGTLRVPEDRATPSGRMIDLNVAVLKAYGSNPAPDPIFWFAGGPGSAATEDAAYAHHLLVDGNERRDLVLIDQRGTGGSNPLTCAWPADPALEPQTLRDCLRKLDADPAAYTTAWSADDVDEVRAALGYDQINLYGGSYGPTMEQVYILRHGDHVRTATLDSTSLLDVLMFEQYPISSQKALARMFARCEGDAPCHNAFPNLRQEFAQALARLEEGPVTLPITDPLTGKPAQFTASMFRTGVHGLLRDTEKTALLPRVIHMVYSEEWAELAALIEKMQSAEPAVVREWQVMNLNILCNEDWAKLRRPETEAVTGESYLTYEDVRELVVREDLCAVMPHPKAEALYGAVANSSVPMLLFSGDADPQDPPENVARARQRYPQSLTLVAPGQSHSYTGVSCRGAIISDFIERGSVDGLMTECLDRVALPPFAH